MPRESQCTLQGQYARVMVWSFLAYSQTVLKQHDEVWRSHISFYSQVYFVITRLHSSSAICWPGNANTMHIFHILFVVYAVNSLSFPSCMPLIWYHIWRLPLISNCTFHIFCLSHSPSSYFAHPHNDIIPFTCIFPLKMFKCYSLVYVYLTVFLWDSHLYGFGVNTLLLKWSNFLI